MRLPFTVSLCLLAGFAHAEPIQKGLTVTQFFDLLTEHAAELAEGGMDLNMVHCTADGTVGGRRRHGHHHDKPDRGGRD